MGRFVLTKPETIKVENRGLFFTLFQVASGYHGHQEAVGMFNSLGMHVTTDMVRDYQNDVEKGMTSRTLKMLAAVRENSLNTPNAKDTMMHEILQSAIEDNNFPSRNSKLVPQISQKLDIPVAPLRQLFLLARAELAFEARIGLSDQVGSRAERYPILPVGSTIDTNIAFAIAQELRKNATQIQGRSDAVDTLHNIASMQSEDPYGYIAGFYANVYDAITGKGLGLITKTDIPVLEMYYKEKINSRKHSSFDMWMIDWYMRGRGRGPNQLHQKSFVNVISRVTGVPLAPSLEVLYLSMVAGTSELLNPAHMTIEA